MASGSNQPFCHSTLSGHTNRHTDRPTHGIGDKSIPTALTLYYTDSEQCTNNGKIKTNAASDTQQT